MTYVSVDDFKTQSGITGSNDDLVITMMIEAAQTSIEGFCNRQFLADEVASVRLYAGNDAAHLLIDEFVEATTVEIYRGGTWETVNSAKWNPFAGDPMRPRFRAPYAGVLTRGYLFPAADYPTTRITARWGYADSVPAPVKTAILAQAHRWFKRGQSAWADTMANSEMGVTIYRRSLDPDIEMMLAHGRLKRAVV